MFERKKIKKIFFYSFFIFIFFYIIIFLLTQIFENEKEKIVKKNTQKIIFLGKSFKTQNEFEKNFSK